MDVEVVENRVRPADVSKLQGDIATQKQDALSAKLLSGIDAQRRDEAIAKLQKELAELTERVNQLEE